MLKSLNYIRMYQPVSIDILINTVINLTRLHQKMIYELKITFFPVYTTLVTSIHFNDHILQLKNPYMFRSWK